MAGSGEGQWRVLKRRSQQRYHLTAGPARRVLRPRERSHVCHVVRTEDLIAEEVDLKPEKYMLANGLIDFYALLGVGWRAQTEGQ